MSYRISKSEFQFLCKEPITVSFPDGCKILSVEREKLTVRVKYIYDPNSVYRQYTVWIFHDMSLNNSIDVDVDKLEHLGEVECYGSKYYVFRECTTK